MKLKYGKEEIQLSLQDKNIIQTLNANKQQALLHPEIKRTYEKSHKQFFFKRFSEPQKSPEDFNRGQRYNQTDTLRSHFTFPIR